MEYEVWKMASCLSGGLKAMREDRGQPEQKTKARELIRQTKCRVELNEYCGGMKRLQVIPW